MSIENAIKYGLSKRKHSLGYGEASKGRVTHILKQFQYVIDFLMHNAGLDIISKKSHLFAKNKWLKFHVEIND
ncbi:MAG: hypothetical protein ACJAUV_000351 [Flavobacteriales bacterium]